jgi:opacity protein-like surface antigen
MRRAWRTPLVRRGAGAALVTVVMLAAGTVEARAQKVSLGGHENIRQGFWWGAAAGTAWNQLNCDICNDSRRNGFTLTGKVGGTVSPSLLLGAEATGWYSSDDPVTELFGSLSAIAQWYPSSTGAFYLKGGFGLTTYRASDSLDDEDATFTSNAMGPQVGLGYDFRVSPNLSINPYSSVMFAAFGSLRLNGDEISDDASFTMIQIGLGLTWH